MNFFTSPGLGGAYAVEIEQGCGVQRVRLQSSDSKRYPEAFRSTDRNNFIFPFLRHHELSQFDSVTRCSLQTPWLLRE